MDFCSEIDLDDSLAMLEKAAESVVRPESNVRKVGEEAQRRPADEYVALSDQIRSAEAYHVPLIRLASKRVAGGMNEQDVLEELEALMHRSEGPKDERWQGHYDDLRVLFAGL